MRYDSEFSVLQDGKALSFWICRPCRGNVAILAEVDPTGSLYACGSINLVILLIFVGSVALVLGAVWLTYKRTKSDLAAAVVAFVLLFTVGPAGWFLSAALAQGSCS